MTTKTAAETAYNLIDIFCMITPPTVLQSDNGREFTAHVIKEMIEICPVSPSCTDPLVTLRVRDLLRGPTLMSNRC